MAERGQDVARDETDEVPLSESEAAEALAVSWKERRQEIAKISKSRQFGSTSNHRFGASAAAGARKSFKVEIEELKSKTKCRRCGRVGHWKRECTFPPMKSESSSAPQASTAGTSSTSNVGYVHWEDAAQDAGDDLLDQFPGATFIGSTSLVNVHAAGLVSSPGYGVVDSGCGKTLVGAQTLRHLEQMINKAGYGPIRQSTEENTFRYGNGAIKKTNRVVHLPLGLAGKAGLISAAVIQGGAPVLLGRPTLEALDVRLNFKDRLMQFLDSRATMQTNSAGQLLVDVLQYPQGDRQIEKSQDPPPPPVAADQVHQHHEQARSSKNKKKVTLKNKECRCLLAQCKQHGKRQSEGIAVAELFSPPRFTTQAELRGLSGLAFDIKQGYDLHNRKPKNK